MLSNCEVMETPLNGVQLSRAAHRKNRREASDSEDLVLLTNALLLETVLRDFKFKGASLV